MIVIQLYIIIYMIMIQYSWINSDSYNSNYSDSYHT